MACKAETIYSLALSRNKRLPTPALTPAQTGDPTPQKLSHALIALTLPKLHFDLDLIRLGWEFLLL